MNVYDCEGEVEEARGERGRDFGACDDVKV